MKKECQVGMEEVFSEPEGNLDGKVFVAVAYIYIGWIYIIS